MRLHSALGYIALIDHLQRRSVAIFEARDAKLEAAREQRRISRQRSHDNTDAEKDAPVANDNSSEYNKNILSEDRALLESNPSADESLESKSFYEDRAAA